MANKKKELDEIFNELNNKPKRPRARNKTVMLTSDVASKVREGVSEEAETSGTAEIDRDIIKHAQETVRRVSSSVAPEPEADPLHFQESLEESPEEKIEIHNPSIPSMAERPTLSVQEQPVALEPSVPLFSGSVEESVSLQEPEPQQLAPQQQAPQQVVRPPEPTTPASMHGGSHYSQFSAPPSPTPESPVSVEQTVQRTEAVEVAQAVEEVVQSPSGSDKVVWEKETKLIGFLVSYDRDQNGEVFFLRVGRLLVSSEEVGTGSLFYINDESVSSMHAVLMVRPDGSIHILDQLSEGGTIIEKPSGESVELLGDKAILEHGDVLKFGERSFKVCLIGADE